MCGWLCIKSYSPEDFHHLVDALNSQCTTKIDWIRINLVFTLNWNYKKEYVDISIPGYIDNALENV